MRAFIAITRLTLRQLLGGKRLIGLGLLALVPTAVTWLVTANLSDRAVAERFHDAPLAIVFLIVVPVVSLILGAAPLGDERRDGTLSFLILRPLPRSLIVGAKLLAAWLATTLIVGGSGALAASVVGVRIGDWSFVGPTVIAIGIAVLAYCAVFLLLGYFTARAVLIGLVYVFIWENGISLAAASLANVSLMRIGLSAYVGMVPEAPSYGLDEEVLGVVAPGVGGALAKALIVAAVVVLFTARQLRRRDLT
jgi:ABC-2 type transport system permease protein